MEQVQNENSINKGTPQYFFKVLKEKNPDNPRTLNSTTTTKSFNNEGEIQTCSYIPKEFISIRFAL